MRISVTEIDAFRRFKVLEDMTWEEFLAVMLKQRTPTRAMEAGRALHTILEHCAVGELGTVEQDGFTFRFDFDGDIVLPRVRELKGEMQVQTSVGPVTLVGVVDGINGAIHDFKLTAKFDAERYHDSYQWRCYLLMFGGTKFIYDVFVGDEKPDAWVIREYHPLAFYAYPGMKEDILRELDEFARFTAENVPQRAAA